MPVSYTHLDVYKRQTPFQGKIPFFKAEIHKDYYNILTGNSTRDFPDFYGFCGFEVSKGRKKPGISSISYKTLSQVSIQIGPSLFISFRCLVLSADSRLRFYLSRNVSYPHLPGDMQTPREFHFKSSCPSKCQTLYTMSSFVKNNPLAVSLRTEKESKAWESSQNQSIIRRYDKAKGGRFS